MIHQRSRASASDCSYYASGRSLLERNFLCSVRMSEFQYMLNIEGVVGNSFSYLSIRPAANADAAKAENGWEYPKYLRSSFANRQQVKVCFR